MSPSSEDSTSAPAAGQPEPATAESEPPFPASSGSPDTAAPEAAPERTPRRRRRRRRKPAPADIVLEVAAENNAAEPAPTGVMLEMAAENAGESNAAEPAQAAPQPAADNAPTSPPRRRRRRRRRRPSTEGQPPALANAGDVTATAAAEAAPGEPAAEGEAANVAPAPGRPRPTSRARRPWVRRPRSAAATHTPISETPAQETPAQETPAGPRRRPRRGNAMPETDPRARRDGAAPEGGERERPRGNRRRDAPDRPRAERSGRSRPEPERRLYALESVVDRGFEDLEEESETRRVHWTIVKRTVADQKSGRQMSAIYMLQRDGVEEEFPNLGAARVAAHKTIMHPEKLTLSKAEHAAARGGGDGKKGR